ncbi:Xyloglucan 6-xylosyltransferase [Rhynchospora pubera]|uniref:Xyloglucan 6-xylosyltransferase n=1 Tax=Rhynchospora pubera TaxID=906938 RepID=A0AAV8HMA3_9POAL|nr:Xyloglucan 6-xylosyltransferase [Rhynchospora pubera]
MNDHPIGTSDPSSDFLIKNSNESHDAQTQASKSFNEVLNQSSNSTDTPNDAEEESELSETPLRSLTDPKYTLGLKINDWDSKRAEWLRLNPAFPNFLTPSKPRVLIVTGSPPKPCIFLLRNCQWSLDLLDAWAPMGPKGPVRDEAGKHIAEFLSNRPFIEADDQSALVYLLGMQRDKWEEKIYFESAYNLHTDWSIAAEKYEEMIQNYHPGLGDWRWPLVTHFVGCKPCGKFADDTAQQCMKQMDRAFNFGDNQILKMYGFTHNSLESDEVERIR